MATTRVRISRMRNLRRRVFSRVPRSKHLLAWLTQQAARLLSSATGFTFTTAARSAVGTLTATANLTGNVAATGVLTASANVTGNVAATGVLAITGNPFDNDTVTIDGKTYTFQTTLTDVDGNVLIGTLLTDPRDNLSAAITLGSGAGTLYAASTTLHPTVTAAAGVDDNMNATAKTGGAAGNSIATTETMPNASWGNATLTGGIDGDTVTIGSQTYTFNATTLIDTADNVLVGASASDSLDNLIAAVNAAAGEGTTYGTGTVIHPDVSVAAGVGDTVDATAKLTGTPGNSIATTETSGTASWGNATLTGGVTSNNLTATSHGVSEDEGPYRVTTTGTVPGGLVLATDYWVDVIDANTIAVRTVSPTGSVVVITTEGVGTHTFTKASDSQAMFEILRRNKPVTVQAAVDIDDLA